MKACPLKAGEGKILCKEVIENRSKGGIILPENRDRNIRLFEILDVGPGRVNQITGTRNQPPYKVGDKCYMDASMQHVMQHDSVEYVVVENEYVWAVVNS